EISINNQPQFTTFCHACSAEGGSLSICLRNRARDQICWSVSVRFHDGIPVHRMPCLIFQKGEGFGIVFHAVCRQLWRLRIKALRNRRGRWISLCSAVADRAVLPVKLDGGNEIFVGQSDRIGALSLATQGRVQRCLCRPRFQPRGGGISIS